MARGFAQETPAFKGIRQSGKTYLLKQLFAPSFPASHYFDLKMNSAAKAVFSSGNLDPQHILQELEFVAGKTIDVSRELLIFDEIQACPTALTALKYFCELMPGAFIAAAGSLLGVHLSQEPFPIGKIDMINVDPLDFREFLSATGENRAIDLLTEANPYKPLSDSVHNRIWQIYGKYMAVGGMPEAVEVTSIMFKMVSGQHTTLFVPYSSIWLKAGYQTLQGIPARQTPST